MVGQQRQVAGHCGGEYSTEVGEADDIDGTGGKRRGVQDPFEANEFTVSVCLLQHIPTPSHKLTRQI
jgi:hypothetical protein